MGRPARPDGLGFSEAEFIVTGLSGAEFPFAAFGPHIRHMILLTGLGGERLWGVDGPVSRDAHQNDDPAGASLAEFCRRCSFVHLPVGWIGFESQPETPATSVRSPAALPRRAASRAGRSAPASAPRRLASTMGRSGGRRRPWPSCASSSASTSRHGASGSLIALTDWCEPALSRPFSRCAVYASWSASKSGSTIRARGWSRAFIAWSGRIGATAASPSSGGRGKIRGRYPTARCGTEDDNSQR